MVTPTKIGSNGKVQSGNLTRFLNLELAGLGSYFHFMRRAIHLIAVPLIFAGLCARAQDNTVTTPTPAPASSAASIAAKEAADERYKQMTSDMEALQSDNQTLHGKIAALEQEIQTLREAQSHAPDNTGIQDDLKRLAEKIQEVDKKRLEDKDAISEQIRQSIERIEKMVGGSGAGLSAVPPTPRETKSKAVDNSTDNTPAPPVDGFTYVIKDGDTLGAIVHAYNEEYKSKGLKPISIRQAKEANPKVDWNRLKVGQKIVIPKPAGS